MQPDWVTYIAPVRLVPLWVRFPPITNVGPAIFAAAVEVALNAQLPWLSPSVLLPPHPASISAKTPATSKNGANLGKLANFMTPPSTDANLFGHVPVDVFEPGQVMLGRLLTYSVPLRAPPSVTQNKSAAPLSLPAQLDVLICCHVHWKLRSGASREEDCTPNLARSLGPRRAVSGSDLADISLARPRTCSSSARNYQSAAFRLLRLSLLPQF